MPEHLPNNKGLMTKSKEVKRKIAQLEKMPPDAEGA